MSYKVLIERFYGDIHQLKEIIWNLIVFTAIQIIIDLYGTRIFIARFINNYINKY